jgi:hypothetical protein
MELSAEELALLARCGIKVDENNVPVGTVVKEKKVVEHKTTDLRQYSAKVIIKCACCLTTEIYWADYVKRYGEAGYALTRVKEPSKDVKRSHYSVVYTCEHCKDEHLMEFDKSSLTGMVKALRGEIRKLQVLK